MGIKDISVVIDLLGDRPADAVAIEFARRLDAHLTGLAIAYDPVVPGYAVAPVPVDFMVSARNEAIAAAKTAEAAFLALAAGSGVAVEARQVEIVSPGGMEDIVHEVRLSDLVIVSEDDRERPEPLREAIIEAVLFHAGAPLLIVPRKAAAAVETDKVVIGWDGSITASRSVRAAMPILTAAKQVEIVIVDDGKPLPTGQRLTAYLARHGISASTRTVPNPHKDVSRVLRETSAELGAGLIVMGAFGHNRLLEWILGGATRGMLRELSIPIVMAH